jgi:hypothetical protein
MATEIKTSMRINASSDHKRELLDSFETKTSMRINASSDHKRELLDSFTYLITSKRISKKAREVSKKVSKIKHNLVNVPRLINQLRKLGSESNFWKEPLINTTCDEEIVLEWWNKNRKLTIYISENRIEYIKVWGPDIDNEMQDGLISSDNTLRELWEWISAKD